MNTMDILIAAIIIGSIIQIGVILIIGSVILKEIGENNDICKRTLESVDEHTTEIEDQISQTLVDITDITDRINDYTYELDEKLSNLGLDITRLTSSVDICFNKLNTNMQIFGDEGSKVLSEMNRCIESSFKGVMLVFNELAKSMDILDEKTGSEGVNLHDLIGPGGEN